MFTVDVKQQCNNAKLYGVLLWIIVRQGPTLVAVGAGGDCLDFFSRLSYFYCFLPLSERGLYIAGNTVAISN